MIYVLWSFHCFYMLLSISWVAKRLEAKKVQRGSVGGTVLDVKRASHIQRLGKTWIATSLMTSTDLYSLDRRISFLHTTHVRAIR